MVSEAKGEPSQVTIDGYLQLPEPGTGRQMEMFIDVIHAGKVTIWPRSSIATPRGREQGAEQYSEPVKEART